MKTVEDLKGKHLTWTPIMQREAVQSSPVGADLTVVQMSFRREGWLSREGWGILLRLPERPCNTGRVWSRGMESSGAFQVQATTVKSKVEKRAGKQRLPFKECVEEGLLGRDRKTAAR